jgi:hypothetical protein
MKRAIPDDEAGAETWHCNRCNITKSVGKFAKWAIRASNHICRTCAVVRSKEAYVLRKGSLDRILMARVRKHMHKAGAPRSDTFRLKLSDMQRLVARQGARSIISGISNLDRLTVARPVGQNLLATMVFLKFGDSHIGRSSRAQPPDTHRLPSSVCESRGSPIATAKRALATPIPHHWHHKKRKNNFHREVRISVASRAK